MLPLLVQDTIKDDGEVNDFDVLQVEQAEESARVIYSYQQILPAG